MSDREVNAIHFYWRPGCGFCMMLDRNLARTGVDLVKHNIWDNPADAATVRRHARGSETVPTVVIGDTALVNPSANHVMSVVADKAPHLLPEDWEPRPHGRARSAVRRLLGG